jgi:hypothetical protein
MGNRETNGDVEGCVVEHRLLEFDVGLLFDALDTQRATRGLSWRGVAQDIWNQSADLNARRNDHPLSAATLSGLRVRRATSCQHALFMLRWLGRAPESLLLGPPVPWETELVDPGPDRRLRWNLSRLSKAVEAGRVQHQLTWGQLAGRLGCTPHQLTGLRRVTFAVDINLTMKIVQWLGCSAAEFIDAAEW